jgi:hypothetical protein
MCSMKNKHQVIPDSGMCYLKIRYRISEQPVAFSFKKLSRIQDNIYKIKAFS